MKHYFSLTSITALLSLTITASDTHKTPFYMFDTMGNITYSQAETWDEIEPFKEIFFQTHKTLSYSKNNTRVAWSYLEKSLLDKSIIIAKEQDAPRALLVAKSYNYGKDIILYQCALDAHNVVDINSLVYTAIKHAHPKSTKVYYITTKDDTIIRLFTLLQWSLEKKIQNSTHYNVFSLSLRRN